MLLPGTWRRAGAAVLAAWFAVFLGESALARTCPMHGASHGDERLGVAGASRIGELAGDGGAHDGSDHRSPAADRDASDAPTRGGSHHDGAGQGADAASAGGAQESSDGRGDRSHDSSAPCDCLGQCLGSAVVAVSVPRDAWQALHTDDAGVLPPAYAWRPAGRVPHRLPFATPPPVGSRAA